MRDNGSILALGAVAALTAASTLVRRRGSSGSRGRRLDRSPDESTYKVGDIMVVDAPINHLSGEHDPLYGLPVRIIGWEGMVGDFRVELVTRSGRALTPKEGAKLTGIPLKHIESGFYSPGEGWNLTYDAEHLCPIRVWDHEQRKSGVRQGDWMRDAGPEYKLGGIYTVNSRINHLTDNVDPIYGHRVRIIGGGGPVGDFDVELVNERGQTLTAREGAKLIGWPLSEGLEILYPEGEGWALTYEAENLTPA